MSKGEQAPANSVYTLLCRLSTVEYKTTRQLKQNPALLGGQRTRFKMVHPLTIPRDHGAGLPTSWSIASQARFPGDPVRSRYQATLPGRFAFGGADPLVG